MLGELHPSKWRHLSTKERKAKGYYPNHIAEADEEVAITSMVSDTDWAINQVALEKAVSLFGVKAYVRLVDGDNNLVAQAPAEEVYRNLRSIKPKKGVHGFYWWVGVDFQSASNHQGGLM
jgi:hypothetical protein